MSQKEAEDRDGPVGAVQYRMRLVEDIRTIPAAQWDALGGVTLEPCARHAFLSALQTSGCVGGQSGWLARFVILEDLESGQIAAAAPLYLKDHSYGEYVFDWAWADAYHRHGLAYYPKGVVAIPFTPVPGVRLLARHAVTRRALAESLRDLTGQLGLSSLHLLYPCERDAEVLQEAGFLRRSGVQFHWRNPGWDNFEDYLAALTQPKRKKIRAERRKVREAGVTVRMLTGPEIGEQDWRFFYACYENTYAQHHSTPYLNLAFFLELGRSMPESLLLARAERQGEALAAAFFLRTSDTLYGRYWGALTPLPCLHFETSYYAPIEWALQQGITRFEGGAQGEHKMARGFQPVPTCSFHHLSHPAFEQAVARFLERETGSVEAYLDELNERTPLRARSTLSPETDD